MISNWNLLRRFLNSLQCLASIYFWDLNDLFCAFPVARFFQRYLNFEVRRNFVMWGVRWRSWLRHCATSRKVAGSIPDGVIGIFYWHNPSSRTIALGSTQPLTQMSTRNISWGVKVVSAYGWQPYHLHVQIVLKSGSLSHLEPSGPPQACNGTAFIGLYTLVHVCVLFYRQHFKIQSTQTRYFLLFGVSTSNTSWSTVCNKYTIHVNYATSILSLTKR